MKSIFIKASLTIFLAVIFAHPKIYGQRLVFQAGANLTNQTERDALITYHDNYHNRLGYHFGLRADIPVNDWLSINTGIVLSTWGYVVKVPNTDYRRKMKLFFLNIPIQVQVTFPTNSGSYFINFGPYLGIGLSGRSIRNGTLNGSTYKKETDTINWGKRSNDDLRRLDAGLTLAVGRRIKAVEYRVSYSLGIANIAADHDFKTQIRNRGLFLTLGILISGTQANRELKP